MYWKIAISFFLLVWVTSQSKAQFSGPAFDVDVYIPQKGSDIDAIYSKYWDSAGWDLQNFGSAPGGVTDRVSFLGYAGNPYYQTIFDAAPPFLLNSLKVVQKSNVRLPRSTIFGHFHSSKVKDALVTEGRWPIIYWADENGLFDSNRRTYLLSSIGTVKSYVMNPYVANLTSDSLEDIILDAPLGSSAFFDSVFFLLYKGGIRLTEHDTIFQDTSLYFGPQINSDVNLNRRQGTTADFRGVGRKDFLAIDIYGNWLYFKNDPPFSLEKFVSSMNSDTLLATWENPHLNEFNTGYSANRFTMRALPRPAWDQSVDFMPSLNTDDWRKKCIAIFRGGPNFGEHRLTLDSAEMYLRSPGLIDFNWSGLLGLQAYLDCGDMTGTGNPVLLASDGYGHYPTYLFFYSLGRAIDDKVDAVIPFPYASLSGQYISLDADGDKYQDMLFGAYQRNSTDEPLFGKAELWLLHGTNRIPAKLNPNYLVSQPSIHKEMRISPNPAHRNIDLYYELAVGGDASIELLDILGRVIWTHIFFARSGGETLSLLLPELLPGSYVATLQSNGQMHTTSLIIH